MARSKEHTTVVNSSEEVLISTREAAERIGRAEITLRLWRWRDNPDQPPYVRIGARGIKYRRADLDAWVAARTHTPGAKPGPKDRDPGRQRRRPGPR